MTSFQSLNFNEIVNNEASTKLKIKKIKYKSDNATDLRILPPLPQNLNFAWAFVGKVKSGKTSCILSLICRSKAYKKKFDRIYIFSPSILSGNLDDEHPINELPEERKFKSFTSVDFQSIIDDIYGTDLRVLIVLDDVQNEFNVGEEFRVLLHAILNRRHICGGLSFMITSQILNNIHAKLRKGLSHL